MSISHKSAARFLCFTVLFKQPDVWIRLVQTLSHTHNLSPNPWGTINHIIMHNWTESISLEVRATALYDQEPSILMLSCKAKENSTHHCVQWFLDVALICLCPSDIFRHKISWYICRWAWVILSYSLKRCKVKQCVIGDLLCLGIRLWRPGFWGLKIHDCYYIWRCKV